ncbi:TPA: hypothetical protein N0F65_004463 [Lagenidium giganteum]|uniref:Uncharacterized protein n=1 Tax=Lagenidium giganteum TaxID=4803 RepID=A0AAV2ZBL3_9STRA|nr:TPA: hypothetical protein N0F65_004463 [Lagenidium giganteum]
MSESCDSNASKAETAAEDGHSSCQASSDETERATTAAILKTPIKVPELKAVHRSWVKIDAYLKQYMRETNQIIGVRETTSCKLRNKRLASPQQRKRGTVCPMHRRSRSRTSACFCAHMAGRRRIDPRGSDHADIFSTLGASFALSSNLSETTATEAGT